MYYLFFVFQILLALHSQTTLAYTGDLDIYQYPSNGSLVFLLADDHSIGSRDDNDQQFKFFISTLVDPAEEALIGLDIYNEDSPAYFLTDSRFYAGGEEFVHQVFKDWKRDAEGTFDRKVPIISSKLEAQWCGLWCQEVLTYDFVGTRSGGSKDAMQPWMDASLSLHFYTVRAYKYVTLMSIDPRFSTALVWPRATQHASFGDFTQVGNHSFHIHRSDFERLLAGNLLLKEEIAKIDQKLNYALDHLTRKLREHSPGWTRERVVALLHNPTPVAQLLEEGKVTQAQVNLLQKLTREKVLFENAVEKDAVLQLMRSVSMGRHGVSLSGLYHSKLTAQHLEAIGFKKIYPKHRKLEALEQEDASFLKESLATVDWGTQRFEQKRDDRFFAMTPVIRQLPIPSGLRERIEEGLRFGASLLSQTR